MNGRSMDPLPVDFAETLARVLEPADHHAAAEVLESAAGLTDDGLRLFLELFAARVRSSARPVTRGELRKFLRAAVASAGASAP